MNRQLGSLRWMMLIVRPCFGLAQTGHPQPLGFGPMLRRQYHFRKWPQRRRSQGLSLLAWRPDCRPGDQPRDSEMIYLLSRDNHQKQSWTLERVKWFVSKSLSRAAVYERCGRASRSARGSAWLETDLVSCASGSVAPFGTYWSPCGNIGGMDHLDSPTRPQQPSAQLQPARRLERVESAQVLGNVWLGGRDSNPDTQIQSLQSYR